MRISQADLSTEALPAAILRTLNDPEYAAAAKRISVRMRARPRTPLQEAAGAQAALRLLSCMLRDACMHDTTAHHAWSCTACAAAMLDS